MLLKQFQVKCGARFCWAGAIPCLCCLCMLTAFTYLKCVCVYMAHRESRMSTRSPACRVLQFLGTYLQYPLVFASHCNAFATKACYLLQVCECVWGGDTAV